MMMKKAEMNEMFSRFSAANPEPITELNAPNEFCLLVAIILSAQATDAGVNKATPALFKSADTPQKMAKLGEAKIRNHIKTIGLFNTKAKNVHAMSHKLLDEFDGVIPVDRELLQTLPGVGRKTANVWLNCVHGHHTIAVDTHVQRVSNRIGLVRANTPLDTEKQLEKKIPKQWMQHAHHWLILHGRYICKARKPDCGACNITDLCQFKGKLV